MTNHTRIYVTACQATVLWLLCLALGVDVGRAAVIAVVWIGGMGLLGYAVASGWLGRRAYTFVKALLGESDAVLERRPDDAQAAPDPNLGPCPHGGVMLRATGACVLDATHPPVICVGCNESVCPCGQCWQAHQERRCCAVDREYQARESARMRTEAH